MARHASKAKLIDNGIQYCYGNTLCGQQDMNRGIP